MPFTKVGKDDYTSPRGNHFNQVQVRLYYANGGKFPGEKKANGGPVMNKGYQGRSVAMAAGGPVLGRTLSFAKDEFTGDRTPPKQSVPVQQEYGGKGAPAKRTGDKSEPAVKPRK